MKSKKITIVLKNCRDDIAKTVFLATKLEMKEFERANHIEFRKKGSKIEVKTRNNEQKG